MDRNPVGIIHDYISQNSYFFWVDPDSVRIDIGNNIIQTDSTISVPLVVNCNQWGDQLPIKELEFQLNYTPDRFTPEDVVFSGEVETMSIHSWADNGEMLGFLISDYSGKVIHSGEPAMVVITFSLLEQEEFDNLPLAISINISSAVDSLDYDLDFSETSVLYLNQLGDLNSDTIINILDIMNEVSIIIGTIEPTDYQEYIGDLNGDGYINIEDVLMIIQLILYE